MLQAVAMSAASLAVAAGEAEAAGAPASQQVSGETVDSRGGKIAMWMQQQGIPPDVVVTLIAAMPIVELRGAVPVAHHVFDMGLVRSFVLSVVGNMLPVPFILLLLGPVSNFLRRFKVFDRFFVWLFNRTRARSETIARYQEVGLIIFIAIPLPATGAWTGALAAFLLGLRFWLSMGCVLAGVAIAGVIVSTFSAFGWIGAVAAGVALSLAVAVPMLSRRKKAAAASPTT